MANNEPQIDIENNPIKVAHRAGRDAALAGNPCKVPLHIEGRMLTDLMRVAWKAGWRAAQAERASKAAQRVG
jgi:ribosome modulation factor